MIRHMRQYLSAALIVFSGMLINACTGTARPDTANDVNGRPVWPQAPKQARIEYVQSITKAEDLGISPGLLDRILGLLMGKDEIRIVRPTAAVMTSDEVLYVADPGARAVHRFDITQKTHAMLRTKEGVPFRSPIALTIGKGNRVYVSDSALNQIFVVEDRSDYAVPFHTDVTLSQPTGIAFDNERDRLYVVNTRQHQVLAFNMEGKLLSTLGRRGAGKGQFNYPTQIWWQPANGRIWITDSLNFRVQQFEKNGRFISAISGVGDATGDLPRPKGIATDKSGHIYVTDALLHTMQIFNPSGELLLYLGDQGDGIDQFWLPVGIFIDSQNRIYIADSFNSRVQVFRLLEADG